MNPSPAPGGLGRGAMGNGANLQAQATQYILKRQPSWIPQGWQKDVTAPERVNNIVQMYVPSRVSSSSGVALTDTFTQRTSYLRIQGADSDAFDMACNFERQTLERSTSKVRPYLHFYF